MRDHPVALVLAALERVTGHRPHRSGTGWVARCPVHDDRDPSLTISEGDDGRALIHCHAGCDAEPITQALGLTLRDLMPPPASPSPKPAARRRSAGKGDAGGQRVSETAAEAVAELERRHGPRSAAWTYHDLHGNPVGLIVRWDRPDGGKDIRPVSHVPAGWIIGGMPTPWPLYNLPALANAKRAYVTEGEMAADAVASLGLVATTSPHGSQSARSADWSPLAGKECVILPDHDGSGKKYAADVARLLATLTPTPTIKVVELPDLPPGGDAVEFIEARDCRTTEEIRAELEILADEAKPIVAIDGSSETGGNKGINGATMLAPMTVCLRDVEPEPIRWLWPGRIPLGKLTLIAGDPGLGKSLVTLDLAARVSSGLPWPDIPNEANSPGGVVLLSAEDDLADTIRPRLDAAGANVSHIFALEAVKHCDPETGTELSAPFCLVTDLLALEAAIEQTVDCRLVVIDPITAYLGRTDSHKNAELRGVLAPLSELAGRYRVAVAAVTHLRKADGPAMYRAMGSLAFTAAARAVWAVTKDKDDPRRRLMLPVKNNLAADVLGLAYTIERSGFDGAPAVAWEAEPVSLSADEALAADRAGSDEGDDTVDFLCQALADGKQPAADVLRQARENGFSEKATRRAFKRLGGKRRREGFGAGGTWYWFLPTAIDSIDAHPEMTGNNGNNGASMPQAAGVADDWGEI